MSAPPPPPRPRPQPTPTKQSRFALLRQLNTNPGDQDGLWLMLALWLVAVLLGVVAIGNGNPVSFGSLLVLVAEFLALGLMMLLWSTLNTGVILCVHTALAGLALPGNLAALGVVSVAVMLGAAEAGQNWWAVVVDREADGATIIEPPNRRLASVEVIGIAVGAAVLVGMLGFFESRAATIAAIGVFIALVIGGILFSRRD